MFLCTLWLLLLLKGLTSGLCSTETCQIFSWCCDSMEPHVWQVQEVVQAAPAVIWRTLTDLSKMHWARSSSLVQLTPGPFGVGTKWQESRPLLFLRDQLTVECTAFQVGPIS